MESHHNFSSGVLTFATFCTSAKVFSSTEWEKIFTNDAADKGLISKINKQLKNQTTQSKNGQKIQTFLQRGHTYGQKTHEKMLNITNFQRNANQNDYEVLLHQSEQPSSKSLQTVNVRRGVDTAGGHVNWTRPLWKIVGKFPKKLKIELPYAPTIPLLGMYLERTVI